MKTNKSFTKRVRITKTGKLLSRKPGQDHFKAKESRNTQMGNNRPVVLKMKNKDIGKFLPNLVNR